MSYEKSIDKLYVFIYGKRNQKTLERGKNKINEADDLSSSGNDKR